jgi:CelD/BcsL family acetyltransferase involved in cellulose biosynthesis
MRMFPELLSTSGPLVRVEVVRDRIGFLSLWHEWNQLVTACGDLLFLRHEFLQVWLEHFAPTGRLRILTGRDARGTLVAALPLIEERTRLMKVPVVQLTSPTNCHSCRFDLLALQPAHAGQAFLEHLRGDSSWDVLRITDVPEGGAAWALLRAAQGMEMPTGTWSSARSPCLRLPLAFEALQQGMSASFRASLRRRRRRLQEQGVVELERLSGGPELLSKLLEGFELEQRGWKGRRGTAIAQHPATLGFYSNLAMRAARAGWLSLYFLRLDGRPIAFDYGLTYGGRYLSLKHAYDERAGKYSPGQLLTEDTLRDCIARGLTEFDFLGDDSPCKKDWAREGRPQAWLYVFRRSLKGRLLRRAKFQLLPAAREALHRWRR